MKRLAKMGADGSRVSAFVFQFGFISGRTLVIWLCAYHQLLVINLSSVSGADTATIPPLRQAVPLCVILPLRPKLNIRKL